MKRLLLFLIFPTYRESKFPMDHPSFKLFLKIVFPMLLLYGFQEYRSVEKKSIENCIESAEDQTQYIKYLAEQAFNDGEITEEEMDQEVSRSNQLFNNLRYDCENRNRLQELIPEVLKSMLIVYLFFSIFSFRLLEWTIAKKRE